MVKRQVANSELVFLEGSAPALPKNLRA